MVDDKIVLVRTRDAGAFVGMLREYCGAETTATLTNARRLWYWSGAASLSELSVSGVKNPDACKFPCAVSKILLTGVIEIIPMTDDAIRSIDAVPVWSA